MEAGPRSTCVRHSHACRVVKGEVRRGAVGFACACVILFLQGPALHACEVAVMFKPIHLAHRVTGGRRVC